MIKLPFSYDTLFGNRSFRKWVLLVLVLGRGCYPAVLVRGTVSIALGAVGWSCLVETWSNCARPCKVTQHISTDVSVGTLRIWLPIVGFPYVCQFIFIEKPDLCYIQSLIGLITHDLVEFNSSLLPRTYDCGGSRQHSVDSSSKRF